MDLSDLFKELVWDNLVKAAVGKLFAALPALAWGPIGYVVGWVIAKFTDQLYEILKLAIELEAIVLRNEAHRKAFDRAAVKLKVLAHEKGIDSPEFRSAREEHKKALSRLVQFAT